MRRLSFQRRNSDLDVQAFARESDVLPERDLDKIANMYRQLLQGIGEDDEGPATETPDQAAPRWSFYAEAIGKIFNQIINNGIEWRRGPVSCPSKT